MAHNGKTQKSVSLSVFLVLNFFSLSRLVCAVPPAVAPPSHLYAANPPAAYSLEQKSFHRRLQEAVVPYTVDVPQLVSKHFFQFPDLQQMQMDSGLSTNHLFFRNKEGGNVAIALIWTVFLVHAAYVCFS